MKSPSFGGTSSSITMINTDKLRSDIHLKINLIGKKHHYVVIDFKRRYIFMVDFPACHVSFREG